MRQEGRRPARPPGLEGPSRPAGVVRPAGVTALADAVRRAGTAGLFCATGLALASCAHGGAEPPPREPLRPPSVDVAGASLASIATALAEPTRVLHLTPPIDAVVVDPLLSSPVLRDEEFQAEVAEWVDYWTGAARPWFPDFLRRMGGFEEMVDSLLADRDLPASLRYLPLIESGYFPGARSHASAVGLWQFMAGTAREWDMEVGPFVDERRDPFKSSSAAVGYLDELHGTFGSWFLTLAAYNGGPTRARRILRRHAPQAQPTDSLFWALRRHWPPETRAFLPKLMGAIVVARQPERYGYERPRPDERFTFDAVEVPDGTTFDVLADAAEVEEEEIRRLNPELYRGFTPPSRAVTVRVPPGRAETFRTNYARIPPGERMTVVEHSVQAGETLSHIARRYGVSVADLRAANPEVRPRFLRIGARLTVPILLARRGQR